MQRGTVLHLYDAPTVCMHQVSGSCFTPLPGFFSPFPHGTGSLSVDDEYLALEDGPPYSDRISVSRPTFRMLSTAVEISNAGLSLIMVKLPSLFFYLDSYYVQAPPRSLITTCGISVDFFSSGFLDGSVLWVRFSKSMYST